MVNNSQTILQRGRSKMFLQCILASEFPYKTEFEKEHGKSKNSRGIDANGIANIPQGEAFVLIDITVGERNLSQVDLSLECCYCMHERKCPLSDDYSWSKYIKNYIDEIVKVSVHELLHLCGDHDENTNCLLTAKITERNSGCVGFIEREES